MAMLDGKKKEPRGMRSGGNVQREKFSEGASKSMKGETPVKGAKEPGGDTGGGSSGGSSTTITHNGDGSHTAQHADGETTEHPSMGHLAMTLHSKHESGPGMHMHQHDGMSTHEGAEGSTHTSHHVGHDGMVEGPHHHQGADAAGEHMKQVLGDGGFGGPGEGMGGSAGGGMDMGHSDPMNNY